MRTRAAVSMSSLRRQAYRQIMLTKQMRRQRTCATINEAPTDQLSNRPTCCTRFLFYSLIQGQISPERLPRDNFETSRFEFVADLSRVIYGLSTEQQRKPTRPNNLDMSRCFFARRACLELISRYRRLLSRQRGVKTNAEPGPTGSQIKSGVRPKPEPDQTAAKPFAESEHSNRRNIGAAYQI
jgi:hypothetical protein